MGGSCRSEVYEGVELEGCLAGATALFQRAWCLNRDNILGRGLGDMFGATRGCSGRLKHAVERNSQGS